MSRRSFLKGSALLGANIAVGGLGMPAAYAQEDVPTTSPIRIIMAGYGPETTSFSLALKQIGDRIETRFEGDVEFKYVYNGFDFDELYDLRSDPLEMVNVADEAAYDEVKHDLVRRMWRFAAQENDIIFNPYGTVALAPWGPGDALAADAE